MKNWKTNHPDYMKNYMKNYYAKKQNERVEKLLTTLEDISIETVNRTPSTEYVAGILDGEGSVCLGRHFNNGSGKKCLMLTPYITLHNTDRKMLEFCKTTIGGEIYLSRKSTETTKTKWQLSLYSSKKLSIILTRLIPSLITKRRRAVLLLEFCLSRLKRGRKGYSERDLQIYEELRGLNQRGFRKVERLR